MTLQSGQDLHSIDPLIVSDHVMSLLPDTTNNAGADFYRTVAKLIIEAITHALYTVGLPYTFKDMSKVLLDEKELLDLERRLIAEHAGEDATRDLTLILDQYRKDQVFDMEKFKLVLGGVSSRLYEYSKN